VQYLAELGNGRELKFYYNEKVYDPHYSSIELPMVANTFVFGRIRLLDIATGCGITGLILKSIHPILDVTLSDISAEAVRISKLNAKRLGLKVKVLKADLIPDDGLDYHVITANLPTFDEEQMALEELHGPDTAYDGGKDGMDLYKRLFKEAKNRCVVLCCEVQEKRQEEFIAVASLNGWKVIEKTTYALALMSAERDMEGMLREIQAQKLVKTAK
jgi:release factor glutamine methyltransferase